MSDALARLRADITRDDVLRAVKENDRLPPGGSSLNTVSARAGGRPSGTNALTPTRPCWERLMSWRRGSAWRPLTSRGQGRRRHGAEEPGVHRPGKG